MKRYLSEINHGSDVEGAEETATFPSAQREALREVAVVLSNSRATAQDWTVQSIEPRFLSANVATHGTLMSEARADLLADLEGLCEACDELEIASLREAMRSADTQSQADVAVRLTLAQA